MSHRKYRIPSSLSCWNCARLRKSRRKVGGDLKSPHEAVSISAPSVIDAIAGYYCDNYWFSDKPDDVMLCGGREYKSVYKLINMMMKD